MSMFNFQDVVGSGFDMFGDLPFHVYGKDARGKYIYVNDLQAKNKGFDKPSGMLGVTDAALDSREICVVLAKNDAYVKTERAPKIFFEPGTTYQGQLIKAISYKLPLCSKHNRVIGVVGASFLLGNGNEFFDTIKAMFLSFQEMNVAGSMNNYRLSPRQWDCLSLLVRGKTDKEIAKNLGISHRTVETHVNEIKVKMHCTTRSQVMEKSFNESMLSLLPMFLM